MAGSDVEIAVESHEDGPASRKSRVFLFSLVLALLLGGGGFYAVYEGLLPIGGGGHADRAGTRGGGEAGDGGDGGAGGPEAAHRDRPTRQYERPAFVALEPYVISLGETASSRHLRVALTIEVTPGTEDDVVAAIPRINDVLNTYLRAVDQRDFEVPRAMTRLRAQMLRRVRLVSPPDSVRDLLFQEFVLN